MALRKLQFQQDVHEVEFSQEGDTHFSAAVNGNPHQGKLQQSGETSFVIQMNGQSTTVHGCRDGEQVYVSLNGRQYVFNLLLKDSAIFGGGSGGSEEAGNEVGAPMPGKLLKLFVSEGDSVQKGERLFIVEAMKMENEVKAARAGVVEKIHFDEGALVAVGQPILEFEAIEPES
ncbi:MAG: acetyl-CoA carboxylase biotin carboxyl carrier protein subunit [Calditrichia bacterium]